MHFQSFHCCLAFRQIQRLGFPSCLVANLLDVSSNLSKNGACYAHRFYHIFLSLPKISMAAVFCKESWMKQVQRKATCLIRLQESGGQASKLHNMFPDQSGLAAQRTASLCHYLCGRRQPRCLLTSQRREWQLCGAKAVRHRHGDVCEETTQFLIWSNHAACSVE